MVEGGSSVRITGNVAAASIDDARPASATRVGVALDALDRIAPWLVGALAVGYCLVFTLMSVFWRDNLRWGFDILVYSQPIWNTAHGHIWDVSIYSWTTTELGHDLVLVELLIAPFYRLFGGNIVLIVLQSAAIALGGVGAYALVRTVMPRVRPIVCALFSVLYLSLLFVQRTNLDEFKSRNIIMWTFFFLWLGYRTNRTWLVWTMIGLALLTRSDVALVVVMFGVYALTARKRWTLSWLPIAVGVILFVMVVYVIVPAHSTAGFIYEDNYGWLGGGLTGIIKSVLTRPWYVAQGVFTAAKLRYTFDLLFPFAFLPLLRPRILLIPLPIYALNMLSSYGNQFSIVHHYNALIVPWLMIAAIEAAGDLATGNGIVGQRLAAFGTRVGTHPTPADNRLPVSAIATALVGVMLLCSLVQQETINSPVQSYLLHHHSNPRAAAGRALIHQVPDNAPLAITQKLAGNTPDRRYIYSFPGDPEYHDPALIDRADYLIGDEQLSAQEQDAIARYRANPAWEVVDERGGFILMRKRQPGSGA
jgi:uncharacterized membrane protein